MSDPKFWWLVLVSIMSGGAWVFAFVTRRNKEADREIAGLKTEVAILKARLEETPSTQSVHEVTLAMERLNGVVKALAERVEGQGEIITRAETVIARQEQWLRERGPNHV